MVDFSFGDERPQRKFHGDILLQVDEVHIDEKSVSGVDLRTGEIFTIANATPEEFAKHFVSSSDQHRPFAERLANAQKRFEDRPGLVAGGDEPKVLSIEVGSVISFENTRTFQTADGTQRTAAAWPKSIVRDPTQEAVLTGTVQATHYETKQHGQRIDVTVVQEDKAASISGFDLESAFEGQWGDLPLTQTGVVIAMRNPRGEVSTAHLTTPYRKYAPEPSLEAALDAPHGTYQIFAAAVIAAKTGLREFDDLKFNDQVNPKKIEIARKIYDAVAASPDNPPFEISVIPMAKTQFIPGDSLTNFMRDYHGTRNGKPSESKAPNPAHSYQGKGFVSSVLAMSRDIKSPDIAPASVRTLSPENKFAFGDIGVKPDVLPRKMREIGAEAAVRVFGETFGSTAPAPEPALELAQDAKTNSGRKKKFDSAPGL